MDEKEESRLTQTPAGPPSQEPDFPPEDEAAPLPEFKSWKERLYDKVPLTVRSLDWIIGLLVGAILVCILLGMLKTRLGG